MMTRETANGMNGDESEKPASNSANSEANAVDNFSSEPQPESVVVSPRRPSTPVVVLIDESEVHNPQESSAAQSPESTEENGKVDESVQERVLPPSREESSVANTVARGRKRRRRVVKFQDDARDRILLPPNQYETNLRRRAIRKLEDETKTEQATTKASRSLFGAKEADTNKEISEEEVMDDYDEDYGDISIGMKLNIIGGKVIVQRVNSLSDGRASPAQLTGLIQRGDVLLSIDNVSLVNLPIDQLMDGLKPMSSPVHRNSYKRSLHLRFATGEGLKLLEKNETTKRPTVDPTFALSQYVTYVDQLSGVPMFDEPHKPNAAAEPVAAEAVETNDVPVDEVQIMTMDQIISLDVAERRKMEQKKYVSEFFTWNKEFPALLRASIMLLAHESGELPLTFSQMIENGERAMLGAKSLFYGIEDIDRGKDTRSFKKWNSTLSLRSRANARRRYVMKTVIQHEATLEEEDEFLDTESAGSSTTGDDAEKGDDFLVQLAAQDEIWRRNVIEVLQCSSKEIEDEEKKHKDAQSSTDTASEGQSLESLLLGAEVSNMLSAKKKSYALPPSDVTSVLFDLMTNLTVTPDEISLSSANHVSPASAIIPFHRSKQATSDENFMFAARFLISQALPAWLKSFRPLPWEQRRVLWPNIQTPAGSLHGAASHDISFDDALTADSGSTGHPSPNSRRYRKDLRQQIEDIALDAQSRAETCVLVTFYFTQEMLPSVASSNNAASSQDVAEKIQLRDLVEFVDVYGSYLKLHLSLVHAAAVRADEVVNRLLDLSRHDPRHREVMKELSKTSLVLYEPTMLSAVLVRLQGIRKEPKRNHRGDLMNICVSAYPDLRPWQVRKACMGTLRPSLDDMTAEDVDFYEMYYEYLSMLLDPSEGHDAARRDAALVTEWCEMSLASIPHVDKSDFHGEAKESRRRDNFYRVAGRTSGYSDFYLRDLFMLMRLSIQYSEIELALNLVDELLDGSAYTHNEIIVSDVLESLRKIAQDALLKDDIDAPILRKIFHLFQKMATNESAMCRGSIVVSSELYVLLQICQINGLRPSEKEFAFVSLLAHACDPAYALETLARWAPNYPSAYHLNSALHVLLQRGAQRGVSNELSGSLLRIRYARLLSQTKVHGGVVSSTTQKNGDINVWRRMFDGSVGIEK